MKLVIITQFRENYGAHDWNGVGSCPQYWKDKGSTEYILDDLEHYLSPNDDFFDKKVRMIVESMLPNIETISDYMTETIINYAIARIACGCSFGSNRDRLLFVQRVG